MHSRGLATWLVTLSSLGFARCAADTSRTNSEGAALSSDPTAQDLSNSPCSAPAWHVISGPSIGRGDAPARHREPEVELDVQRAAGFGVERASLVYAAQGNRIFVEIKNLEARWRCGIRSYPSLAFDAAGERTDVPMFDDTGYSVLGATGMQLPGGEGIHGSCLGPGESGYLEIRVTPGLAKVSLQLEATSDSLQVGPAPECVVPQSYTYEAGKLSIQAKRAGTPDAKYKPAAGSGLAIALLLDAERLPLALFSLAPDASAASDPDSMTFSGFVNASAGPSQSLAVLVW